MTWINTETDEQANLSSIKFWDDLRNDLNSEEFWADKIKEFRGEPVKRLAIAYKQLPLPAAFREASIALRALIRTKKKSKETFVDELALLYWFAAINSLSIPYSKYLQQPGYNVIESIPGNVIKTLSFSYFELGYEKLDLLNKTDIKWFIGIWGEPQSHTTIHELHHDVWNHYEKALPAKQKKNLDGMLAKL
jgi:hypothetical protein